MAKALLGTLVVTVYAVTSSATIAAPYQHEHRKEVVRIMIDVLAIISLDYNR